MYPLPVSRVLTRLSSRRDLPGCGLLGGYAPDYCSSWSAVCGTTFAWASMAVAACDRTCERVKAETSVAMSASLIEASEFWIFSIAFSVKEMVKADLDQARKEEMIRNEGFTTFDRHE